MVLRVGLSFCRNSVVPSENVKAVFQGTLAPAWHCSPSWHRLVPAKLAGQSLTLQPRSLLSAWEPRTVATARQGWQWKGPDAKL